MSYRELVEALGLAVQWIADAQRYGCPAGVVAVPSRIRDAYICGKDALRMSDELGGLDDAISCE